MLSTNLGIGPGDPELAVTSSNSTLDFESHGLWASEELYNQFGTDQQEFNVFLPWADFDPTADGFQLTYSYSNFLSDSDPLPGGLTDEQLQAATEEALGLWASFAPLHFLEVPDIGPAPSDASYAFNGPPHIRIGHHLIDGASRVLAHAFFPQSPPTGLAGDVHFDSGDNWGITPGVGRFDVIEVMTHELGHSLGVLHETGVDAIMNPFIANRFSGPGTGFLFQDDIDGIQALYGSGVGSVTPLQPLVVDIIVDEIDGDTDPGDLSLREAIDLVNTGGISRTITFDESLAGQTMMLDPNLGSLRIEGPLTIEGLGSGQLTIQAPDPNPGVAGDGLQIFVITNDDPDLTVNVEISGLTLMGADSDDDGGAIFTEENLALEDVHLLGNATTKRGGAVFSTGELEISTAAIEANSADDDGGAIYTSGGVKLDSSTVSNNVSHGGKGGAIAAAGVGTRVELVSSTISGNIADGDGGGIHVIDQNPAVFRAQHSTIFDNHSTTGSGGGIYLYNGVLVLDHTIVAANTDNGEAPDIDNLNLAALPAVLAKFSLIGDNTGAVITQIEPNVIGIGGAPVDPVLDVLADNGGPTKTHVALDGSPAIDAGDGDILTPPEFDQRGSGFDRIAFGAIDIGAIESIGFDLVFTVDTLVDESDGDHTQGDLSLREALMLANDEAGRDLINFAPALSGGTIHLDVALGELVISSPMTLDAGNLAAGLTINASSTDLTPTLHNGDGARVLRIDDGSAATLAKVEIDGITFTGGDVTGDGGGILSLEQLTLTFVSIVDNSATGNGGGLYHKDGMLVVENSAIVNNEATDDGGGLWSNTNFTVETGRVTNTTLSGNTAGDEGGGIFNFDGLLSLQHLTVTANTALKGGGVVSFGDPATETRVFSSIIAGNTGFDVERSRNVAHNSFVSEFYNLIGIGNAQIAFDNNAFDQIDVLDPMLGSLTNNGGKTVSHAPLPGSLAIDSSDPAFVLPTEGSTQFDQRGEPFSRLGDGDNDGSTQLDIGAFEVPTPKPNPDFDNDGDNDGFDFLAWQRGFGTASGATRADGDSDNDGDVDGDDLGNWEAEFGVETPAESSSGPIAYVIDETPAVPIVEPAPFSAIASSTTTRYDLPSWKPVALASRSISAGPRLDDQGDVEPIVASQVAMASTSTDAAITELNQRTTNLETRFRPSASLWLRRAEAEEIDSLDVAFERLAAFGLRGGG